MRQCCGVELSIEGGLDPETRVAYDFWQTWRGSAAFAQWSAFDLTLVPAEILPKATVIDVLGDSADFRYRYVGTWQCSLHGRDLTGTKISEFSSDDFKKLILEQLNRVLENRAPMLFTIEIPRQWGLIYHSKIIRFPLSEDGQNINHIISFENETASGDYAHNQEVLSEKNRVFG